MRYAYRVTDGALVIAWEVTNSMEELRRIKNHAENVRGYKFEAWELDFKEIEV